MDWQFEHFLSLTLPPSCWTLCASTYDVSSCPHFFLFSRNPPSQTILVYSTHPRHCHCPPTHPFPPPHIYASLCCVRTHNKLAFDSPAYNIKTSHSTPMILFISRFSSSSTLLLASLLLCSPSSLISTHISHSALRFARPLSPLSNSSSTFGFFFGHWEIFEAYVRLLLEPPPHSQYTKCVLFEGKKKKREISEPNS